MKCCSCGSTEPKPAADEDEEESIPAPPRVPRRTPHQLTDLHVSPRRNRNHNLFLSGCLSPPHTPRLFLVVQVYFFGTSVTRSPASAPETAAAPRWRRRFSRPWREWTIRPSWQYSHCWMAKEQSLIQQARLSVHLLLSSHWTMRMSFSVGSVRSSSTRCQHL